MILLLIIEFELYALTFNIISKTYVPLAASQSTSEREG
jgi:hypothetical protein